jgi:DNA-directed RNA polymerase subunit RPC12/RpoP
MKVIKLFIYSAGAIFLAAALERLLIIAGDTQALTLPDPLLGIPLRYAVLLVGTFELAMAMTCLFGRQVGVQLGWLAWLTTNYMVFRIGLLTMNCHQQATCVGSLTDPLHLTQGVTGFMLGLLPVYLLLGSYAAIIWLWMEGRKAKSAKFLKMSCSACGIHIRFDGRNLGQNISCPHCKNDITLRKPDLLKMTCFFCKEHIEFPSHALGEKIPCPHCKMDITLKEPA